MPIHADKKGKKPHLSLSAGAGKYSIVKNQSDRGLLRLTLIRNILLVRENIFEANNCLTKTSRRPWVRFLTCRIRPPANRAASPDRQSRGLRSTVLTERIFREI